MQTDEYISNFIRRAIGTMNPDNDMYDGISKLTRTMDSDEDIYYDADVVVRPPPPPPTEGRFTRMEAFCIVTLYLALWVSDKYAETLMKWVFGPVEWPLATDTSYNALVFHLLVGMAVGLHMPLARRTTPLEVRPYLIRQSLAGAQARQGPLLFV